MKLPTITDDDLEAFQATRFSYRASATSSTAAGIPAGPILTPEMVFAIGPPFGAKFTWSTEGPKHSEYEADDGLGYYSDGVKRTLSDADIDFCRQSEIQILLRERRKRREAGSSASVSPSRLARHQPDELSDTGHHADNVMSGERGSDSENEDKASTPNEDSQPTTSQRTITRYEWKKLRRKRKQKQREWEERQRENRENPTLRRLAREMDEQEGSEVDLDY
ncbi:MAG: hypothetical protein M1820_006434 [Bogoriella megaspora]|nr:MAG: hypothetical protein M1820_006434 [Bogoriella megaspora]